MLFRYHRSYAAGRAPCSCALLPGRKIAPLFGRQLIDQDIHGCQFETRHFLIDFLRYLMHPVIQFSLLANLLLFVALFLLLEDPPPFFPVLHHKEPPSLPGAFQYLPG